jgi:soluble lytic murein transglycosylase
MGGWIQATVFAVVAALAGTTFEPRSEPVRVGPAMVVEKSVAALTVEAQLAAKDQELRSLRQQLEAFGDAADYAEAQRLGIAQAVKATGLTERQQKRLSAAIVREAKRNSLDPLLVVALIRVESSFNNFATSSVGARGLMQVTPETGHWLLSKRGLKLSRKEHLFDYELNLELGTEYLAQLIHRFGGVERALLAYNVGPTAARRMMSVGKPPIELSAYPGKVLGELSKLKTGRQRAMARAANLSERG